MKKIFILALFLRLIIILLSQNIDNYDLQSYFLIGKLTSKRIDIYPDAANLHHPYFPAFLYIESLGYLLGKLGGFGRLGTILIIKFIISLFDIGNIYLVYLLSNKNLKKAFLYAINPVSILIFAFHGQFDSIPIFFLLLAIYFSSLPLGYLFLSLAIMIKTWPVLFIFTLFKRLKNKKLILLLPIFPIISILFYIFFFNSKIIEILKTLISYQGVWGIWGLSVFFNQIRFRWQKLITLLFLSSFFIYSLKIKRKNIIDEILTLLFFFFTFTTNFSIQYLSWLMPFLTIIKPRNYWLITISISIFIILTFLARIFLEISALPMKIIGLIFWIFLASIYLGVYRKKYIV